MRFTLPIIALAALAVPAIAEDVVDVRISYADIDLASAEGRANLEKRVEDELRKACTYKAASRYTYGREVLDEKCVAEARSVALAKVERVIAARSRAGGQIAAN